MANKIALVIVLITIGFSVIATSHHYGITWDEPGYFKATALHMEWTKKIIQASWAEKASYWLNDSVITRFWHWDPYHVPHPPFTRILSGLTWLATGNSLGEVRGFRLSTTLFFLILLWVVWAWTRALTNTISAWMAMLSTLALPHLFGHAHFAMTDIPIAALWILTAYAFWQGLEKTSWSVAFGLFLGLAMATKFPGFLIPLPLILWSFLYQNTRSRIYKNFFAAVFLSPLVLILIHPYFWHFPLTRILEFINASTTRTSFGTLFYNKIYSTSQLPWYYSFFMVGVSIPTLILFTALAGLFVSLLKFRSSPEHSLPLFCASFLLITPLMPGAVIHDGVRLLLPAFWPGWDLIHW
jgi:4-amino-4-deoxy-L-arabinose transferase-like glycosyltransferase